jgi:hypothetical protein
LKLEARLSSRYSITIYEYCKDYIKVEIPKLEITTFKKLLGIEGGYDRIFDIRHKVIEKSLKEINEKTDITITGYELIKEGKKIKYVKFHAEMKDSPPPSPDAEGKETFEEISEELELIPKTEKLTSKQKKELESLIGKYGSMIVRSNIEYTNNQNYKKYYTYLRKAIMEDYAESDRMNAAKETVINSEPEIEINNETEIENKELLEVYEKLDMEAKAEIEEAAEKELSVLPGIEYIGKTTKAYESMRRSKITEITKLKYGKIKSLATARN